MTGGTVQNDGTLSTQMEKVRVAGTGRLINNGHWFADADTELVVEDGGYVETSIWDAGTQGDPQYDNAWTVKNITLNEGGVLNINKLNAGGTDDAHTRLLLAKGESYTLNGGRLQVAGQDYHGDLKVGAADRTGTLIIKSGDYSFDNVELGAKGTITLNGGNFAVNDSLTFSPVANGTRVTLAGGTLTTQGKNVFTKNGEGNTATWGLNSEFDAHVATTSGVVAITDQIEEYTLEQWKAAQNLLDASGKVHLVFTNGTLKPVEGPVEAGNVDGLYVPDVTVVANAGTATFNADTVVANIDFGEAETAKITTVGNAALTLAGNGGDVFKTTATSVRVRTLNLGVDASSVGHVNTDLVVQTLNVNGTFDVSSVTIQTVADVTTRNAVTPKATINGTMVLNGAREGKAELSGAFDVFGLMTTNLAAGQSFQASLTEPAAVFYVDRAVKLGNDTTITVGKALPGADTFASGGTTITVNEGAYLVVDSRSLVTAPKATTQADTPVDNTVFGEGTTIKNNGRIVFAHTNKTGVVDLGASVTGTVVTDNAFITATAGESGVVTLEYNNEALGDETLNARLAALYDAGATNEEVAILEAVSQQFKGTDGRLTTAAADALRQATGGNATSGALNVAYDSQTQFVDAIARHQLAQHQGMGVWADVYGTTTEATSLYGTSGYSADIYGGVLGFDATFSNGATAGLAVTVGTAEADSEDGVLSTSLDSDFYGVSLYAQKDMAGLNWKADVGYMSFDNKLTGLGSVSDVDSYTVGLRGDFTAYQGQALRVKPHFGIRYIGLDSDAVAFNGEQDMDIIETPVGVTVDGQFTAAGWNVVPAADFSIVPQLGDKRVEAFGYADDVKILNSGLYNTTLGVAAQKDNLSFGMNYRYGFGNADRENHSLNLNVRYNF